MKSILVVLFSLFLAGCATFYAEKANKDKIYPPTNAADVEILEQAPSGAFTVIGSVRAEGETISIQENMKQRLKEEAAAMGGDAIILEIKTDTYRMRNEGVAVGSTYGVNLNKAISKKMTGKVIRFEKEN